MYRAPGEGVRGVGGASADARAIAPHPAEGNGGRVVIADDMPVLGGIDAMVRIRHRDPDVQIIVFSAEDDPATTRAAADAGASELLVKGAATAALCEAVARAVARRERGRGPAG
ncbi:MAG TPA: response regulator [Actinomycetota bacterium]